jgi:hypothetical protein
LTRGRPPAPRAAPRATRVADRRQASHRATGRLGGMFAFSRKRFVGS